MSPIPFSSGTTHRSYLLGAKRQRQAVVWAAVRTIACRPLSLYAFTFSCYHTLACNHYLLPPQPVPLLASFFSLLLHNIDSHSTAVKMVNLPEGYPKPRHEYLYQPTLGLGNRGSYIHRFQHSNGALPQFPFGTATHPPTGYGMGYGMGYGVGMGGYGMGYGMGYPGAVYPHNLGNSPYRHGYGCYGTSFPSYGYGCYPYGYYGLCNYANWYYPYQRYYTPTAAAVPATAVTYATPASQTTTYICSTAAPPVTKVVVPAAVRTTTIPTAAYVCGRTQNEIQLENRRIATERGAYAPRRIKPADAANDDPFWCREVSGEWHLRTFYQIENECYPGRWTMDAEIGFLVFHRE